MCYIKERLKEVRYKIEILLNLMTLKFDKYPTFLVSSQFSELVSILTICSIFLNNAFLQLK